MCFNKRNNVPFRAIQQAIVGGCHHWDTISAAALILNCCTFLQGVLSQLDTQTPVMYLDFPQGRLKLFGSLVFPKSKYMVLRLGGSSSVLCEDVFENIVVFSEYWWVGTKEANPDEKKLPLPQELSTSAIHTNYEYSYGAGN